MYLGSSPETGDGASAVDLVEVVNPQTFHPRPLVNSNPLNSKHQTPIFLERDRDLRPGRGLPMSTSRSKWFWRDSAPTVSSPAGGFGIEVWDFGLGFGVVVRGLHFGDSVEVFCVLGVRGSCLRIQVRGFVFLR